MLQSHDDPMILAGQATAGIEILRQHSSIVAATHQAAIDRDPPTTYLLPTDPLPTDLLHTYLPTYLSYLSSLPPQGEPRPPLNAIFLPVGGGSLLAGVAAAVKQLHPAVKVRSRGCSHV